MAEDFESLEHAPKIGTTPETVGVFVAWPYGNGPRHLGHGASLVPGDVIARYYRSVGSDVLMVSGTDEYGTPNMIAAEKAGIDPSLYVEETNQIIREDFQNLGMSFDWFTRTTSEQHRENAQEMFVKLVDGGYVEKGSMLGAFDSTTGQSLPDRYVEGGCPTCGAGARGDQCDACSTMLEPTELLDPISKITNNPVSFRLTEHYFLLLDKLAPDVIEWLDQNENLRPNAKASSMEMAKMLRPRAITRDMSWGIPLPKGYELDSEEGDKVLYVWFEAVTGYLSASIEWAKQNGNPDGWKQYWESEDAEHFYVMGKDNVPFHTIVWPAIIAGANKAGFKDGNLHQPDTIASTEYMNFNNGKLSSSRGNVVYIRDMVELIGPDALRYYFIVAGPETRDTNFSFHELSRRVNDELIAKWGNLVGRSVSLIHKNHGGEVPQVDIEQLDQRAKDLLADIDGAYDEVGELIKSGKFSLAIKKVMDTTTLVNIYINEVEPWKTAKEDKPTSDKDMYIVLNAVANLAVLTSPFLPHSSQRIHELLGNEGTIASQPESRLVDGVDPHWVLTGDYSGDKNHWKFRLLKSGQKIGKLEGQIFRKLDEDKLIKDFNELAKQRKLGELGIKASSK